MVSLNDTTTRNRSEEHGELHDLRNDPTESGLLEYPEKVEYMKAWEEVAGKTSFPLDEGNVKIFFARLE